MSKILDREELKAKKLLSRKEAAFYMGVSLGTLQRLTQNENFHATVRASKYRVLINKEILDKWLIDNKTKL